MKEMKLDEILNVLDNRTNDGLHYSKGTLVNREAFFDLILYYAGKKALEAIDRNATYVVYAEDKKIFGNQKPKAKQYLELFVKMFNDYFRVEDHYKNISHSLKPEMEKTGHYEIKGRLPEIIAGKINELYKKNYAEDEEVILKLIGEENQKALEDKKTKANYDALCNLE